MFTPISTIPRFSARPLHHRFFKTEHAPEALPDAPEFKPTPNGLVKLLPLLPMNLQNHFNPKLSNYLPAEPTAQAAAYIAQHVFMDLQSLSISGSSESRAEIALKAISREAITKPNHEIFYSLPALTQYLEAKISPPSPETTKSGPHSKKRARPYNNKQVF